jgi:hypothetical protein
MWNSRVYEGREEVVVDFPVEWERGFAALADNYPDWLEVGCKELRVLGGQKEREAFVRLLFGQGLVMVMVRG